MRLAMRVPEKQAAAAANEDDPREAMDGEVVDLASRHSLPAVANGKNSVVEGLERCWQQRSASDRVARGWGRPLLDSPGL